jgi:hypothetical protein
VQEFEVPDDIDASVDADDDGSSRSAMGRHAQPEVVRGGYSGAQLAKGVRGAGRVTTRATTRRYELDQVRAF